MAAGFRHVICSASEITALANKAARGGGAPPGQAAFFGRAVLYHLAADRDQGAITDALAALPEGPILTFPLLLLQMIERAGTGPVELPQVDRALSDLFLSYAAAHPSVAEIDTDGGTCRLATDTPGGPALPARITLPDALAERLAALAALTHVPETEASRRAGAGAGLSDND